MAHLMVWAVSLTDESAKHITEVKAGLDCSCVCPGCRATLEAVNSENPSWKRRPHFRHEKSPELENCVETALVTAAKSCITALDEILLPGAEIVAEARTKGGKIVRHIQQIEPVISKVTFYEFVDSTDAVLTLEDGQQIYVRLIASGGVATVNSPKQGLISEVIIDISDPVLRTADRATLRTHISLSQKHRVWCKNQRWASWEAQANLQARQRADEVDDQLRQERENQQLKQRKSSNSVGREYVWASSLPSYTSRRARQVQITINHYRKSGGFGPPVSNLPFERILQEAESQRLSGTQLSNALEDWDSHYGLRGNKTPLINILLVAGLLETRTIPSDKPLGEVKISNQSSESSRRLESLKKLLFRAN